MSNYVDDDELLDTLAIRPTGTSTGMAGSTTYGMAESENRRREKALSTAPQPKENVRMEQRIGQYTIIKTLGEGSFGKVKLAVHRGTGQKVALKIIARKKLISRDMQGRVEREIEYLQLLRHPHIIKL
jgi:carbon catabolite-derepressing protein kinase